MKVPRAHLKCREWGSLRRGSSFVTNIFELHLEQSRDSNEHAWSPEPHEVWPLWACNQWKGCTWTSSCQATKLRLRSLPNGKGFLNTWGPREVVLWRNGRQAPSPSEPQPHFISRSCCAAPVSTYLENKRTYSGHMVNGKANIGGSNWWFARSKSFKPGNRDDPCLLIIIQ